MTRGPGNHYHPELWTRDAQHRYEDRVGNDLKDLEKAVTQLTNRVTMLMGGIALAIFVIPIVAPFIRGMLGL